MLWNWVGIARSTFCEKERSFIQDRRWEERQRELELQQHIAVGINGGNDNMYVGIYYWLLSWGEAVPGG